MKIYEIIKKDLVRFAPTQGAISVLKVVFLSHTFHLVLAVRLGQFAGEMKFFGKGLRVLIEYWIRIFFASDISCRAKIGGGLMIVHGHDIVIGANVVIGENCKIFNGVTLGNKDTESGHSEQPRVGDMVVFSTGCKILGPIHIGSNVIIGANSVVLHDIPSDSIAVGIPARINQKKKNHDN